MIPKVRKKIKMGMKYIKFNPCPECSESERPYVVHNAVYAGVNGELSFQTFYAQCRTCGYETKRYDHVIDLVTDWNVDSAKAWPFPSKEK